jgi:cullin 1
VAAAKGPSKDTGTPAEQQFVRSLIELHDKYLGYVSTCFMGASLFHKSLKDAFEVGGQRPAIHSVHHYRSIL